MLTAGVLDLVTTRHGVVSRAELRAAGLSDHTIRRQVAAKVWLAEGRSALVVPSTAPSLAVRTRILAINHPSLTPTGPSALALIPDSPLARFVDDTGRPWMIGPRDGQGRWLAVVHPDPHTVERSGLVVACEVTAVVDMLRYLPSGRAAELALAAVQTRRTTLAELQRYADNLDLYAGSDQLRSAILALSDGAQSVGERRIVAGLTEAGLTGWLANYELELAGRRVVIDIAFPGQRIAVEFDGWAFHSSAQAFQRDRERQNLLVNHGWVVLRFTWADLDGMPGVIAQVKRALAARLPLP